MQTLYLTTLQAAQSSCSAITWRIVGVPARHLRVTSANDRSLCRNGHLACAVNQGQTRDLVLGDVKGTKITVIGTAASS
ncbi:hypothetical protein K431DRAFT_289614 [Polychaeton citri CBS 116435]|uniref:Uncharacterized protein n=1 Tax=Polychaeton citri CBS 116435 TaxID=1314669 RepID=A0A9P4PWH5_9PEZI|nr:hypothetical protein K431DRAFT_289614 [Polychaeton citri CBS 116435]